MNEGNGFFDGSPKLMFVFGLVTGVAVTSLLGGGINLPKIGASTDSGSEVVREFKTGDTAGADDAQPSAAGELAAVTGDEHIRGDIEKAEVVLVEYSDFECPFCQRHHPNMLQAMEDYGDDVAWVYRHFPLSIHPQAEPSGSASECAAEQGAFWEFADAMFDNQSRLGDSLYEEVAGDIGLNVSQFMDCYESGKYESEVTEDQQSGIAAGVQGTPATFVNGVMVSGAVPYATLQDAIETELGN